VGRDFEDVLREVWPEDAAAELIQRFRRTLETGVPHVEREQAGTRVDTGAEEYYDWQIHRVPLPNGTHGVVCYFRDVTEQVRARLAIAESKERYRTLFHSIDQGFCVLEVLFDEHDRPVDYRFLEINPTFADQTGLEDAEGRRALELVPELSPFWIETYAAVARSRQPQRFERFEPAMDRWFDVYAFPTGPAGENRIALRFQDITAEKEAARALVRQKDQLQALYSLSEAIQRATGVGEMCTLAIERLIEATRADRASILLFDHEDRMRFRAWHGLSDAYRSAVEHHTPWTPDDTDAEPIAVEDVFEQEDLAPFHPAFREEGLRAMAFIPLIGEERVLGKFMVYFNEPHAFTDDEIAVCKAAAASVALSIDRAAAAEALRSERDLVRTIAQNSTSALAMIDERGYCTYANRAMLEMTGFTAEELGSRPLHDLIHHTYPDGRPFPIEECPIDRALPENHAVRAHEDLFFRKDGSSFPVLCAASPVVRDGRPVSTVVEIRDVTAEKEAEVALRESEQRFRMMADTAPALLWVTDTDNRCTFLSRGWYEYTGQEPGTGQGFGWLDMVHPDDRPGAREGFLAAATEHRAFRLDFRLRRHDGQYRWVFDEGRARFDADGRWQGYIGSVVDVHDRQVVADALMESERNLRALSNSLEQRVAERTTELRRQTARLRNLASQLASAEQRERKRLAAVLHDDLQQLLFAALIRLGAIPASDDRTAGAVAEATRHLSEAITSARALTHQLRPPALYEAGLAPALEWLATQMAQRYDLEVDLQGTTAEPPESDDVKALLFDCVRELLFNVVKYARVKHARVELERDGDTFRLRVSDDGAGFDLDQLTREDSASGFGLFSVRERLAALSGTMDLDTAPGAGTRVTLTVPVGLSVERGADFLRHAPAGAARDGAPLAADGTGPAVVRVVLADDHAIVRDGLATILSSSEAIAVVGFAADGVEAVRVVEELRPDVVLMDLNMPRMNGVEATEAILARFPHTAIIGLSIQGDEATQKSMLAAGAAAFIPKAEDSEGLVERILAVAQSRQRGDGSSHAAQEI
jgi:PAS domain S-box-containing protein